MVNLLLEYKADSNLDSKRTDLSLMGLATLCRKFGGKKVKALNPKIILALLTRGEKVDALVSDGTVQMSGLYYACQEGDLEAVKILVKCFSADTNFVPLAENRFPFLPSLKGSPLLVAISRVGKNIAVYAPVIEYLLEQDFVPLKMKVLNEILSFKTALKLPDQAVKNIEINKQRLSLLIQANGAFNAGAYTTATACAREGLILGSARGAGMYNTQQHNEKLLKVLYLSHYALKDYGNARSACLSYVASLQEKLEINLHPDIHIQLQQALATAQTHLDTMNAVLPKLSTSLFWQLERTPVAPPDEAKKKKKKKKAKKKDKDVFKTTSTLQTKSTGPA